MDRNPKIELRRVFLTANLPEPLTRASSHMQIFDNYIENTRLRLRSVRVPETKQWTYILEQRFPADEKDLSIWNVSEIFLNETEHAAFEQFEGREVRKNERVETNEVRFNRYFYDYNGRQLAIDAFLGALWGLNLVKIFFESEEEMRDFIVPEFAISEVTNEFFFTGANLVAKNLSEVRAVVSGKR
jgi:CYTH domain-containing protein